MSEHTPSPSFRKHHDCVVNRLYQEYHPAWPKHAWRLLWNRLKYLHEQKMKAK